MTRILLFIKHRLPALWSLVEWLNTALFILLHRDRMHAEAKACCDEFLLDGFEFRPLGQEDLDELYRFINDQSPERLAHFQPHGFGRPELSKQIENPAFLMFGVFRRHVMVGYFFLRCFWNKRCFVGRLIDEGYQKRGIGRAMNDIMYNTAWRSNFRCHTTIFRHNELVMRSHRNNPAARIIGDLPNGYLFIEFVAPDDPGNDH